MVNCDLANKCGGCPWISLSEEEQKYRLEENLKQEFQANCIISKPKFEFVELAKQGLRDRVDLSLYLQNGKYVLGLYDLEKKHIVDIKHCPQMSTDLQICLNKFREKLPQVELGSVRLRVGPNAELGVWLDFPNKTIKELLEEKESLKALLQDFHIEMGQKRKTLIEENGKLRLKETTTREWFQTYIGKNLEAINLNLSIGSFSQTGFQANRVLVYELLSLMQDLDIANALEVCCGIGNFTLPLATACKKLTAIENDSRAIHSLQLNLAKTSIKNVSTILANIYSPKVLESLSQSSFDLIVVDPPRSGLKEFLPRLLESQLNLKYFLYISCFAPSFSQDLKCLEDFGFTIDRLKLVDQFPQSKHCEYIALLSR